MEFLYLNASSISLGWEFYGSLGLIFTMIMLGIPIWVAIGLGVAGMMYATGALPMALIGESLFEGGDAFALIAVPLFILTGDILVKSGLSHQLMKVAESAVGGVKSGLGSATVLTCGLFACISGSDAADASAVGKITIGRLVEKGYPKPYACALVAAGACTGILIPPSIGYIIIGLVLGISSTKLFLAGAIPGTLIRSEGLDKRIPSFGVFKTYYMSFVT